MSDALAHAAGLSRAPGPVARSRGAPSRSASRSRLRAASPQRVIGSNDRAGRMAATPAQRPLSPFRTAASRKEQSLFMGSSGDNPLPKLRGRRRPIAASMKFPGTVEDDTSAVPPKGSMPLAQTKLQAQGSLGMGPTENSATRDSIDSIESQAKQSLSKLKHLLYKLRTRKADDVSGTLVAVHSGSGPDHSTAPAEPSLVEDEQRIFVAQKIEVDMSSPPEDADVSTSGGGELELRRSMVEGELDVKSLQKGLEFQLDALTCTRARVTFDEEKQTAVVTVTATVRAAELADEQSLSEQAVAMATRALARTCLDIDERAQAAALSASASSASLFSALAAFVPASTKKEADSSSSLSPPPTANLAHQRVQRALLTGAIVSYELASPEFGCTPFRPVYLVKLQDAEGATVEALFKLCVGGDRMLRWKRAQDDWVAYQLACLLGIDMVPPTVIRSGVTLGSRTFDTGVMLLIPAPLQRLESTDPTACTRQAPPGAVVSDIRILDALLGNALRPNHAFLASSLHWADSATSAEGQDGSFHPVVLGQPMGARLGCALHGMWTAQSRHALQCGVPVVTKSTLGRLKGLCHSMLLEVFGGVLEPEEIEMILVKRDHLLAYFDSLCRKLGYENVCL